MYTPQAGDEGLSLFLAALRDYLLSEPTVTEVLQGVIPEGFLTESTATPVAVLSMVGDGESAYGRDVQLCRLLVYVLDRDRGQFNIEKGLSRIRKLINDTERCLSFFSFPVETGLSLTHLEATGTTASATFPKWGCEGRGLYIFAHLRGLTSPD